MKLKNSTGWSDTFLRRMVAWCCHELDMPVRTCREARFRNRSKGKFSGHAYCGPMRIVVSIGPEFKARNVNGTGRDIPNWPWTDHGNSPGIKGIVRVMADRTEALINVTAHELRHLRAIIDKEKTRRRDYYGSSERLTELDAQKVLTKFRENRESLLAEWSAGESSGVPVKKSLADVVAKRAAKAAADLARWERKLKLAKTKVSVYRRKVKYYERRELAAIPKGSE